MTDGIFPDILWSGCLQSPGKNKGMQAHSSVVPHGDAHLFYMWN
jgi:hypothetical protein